jgi:hypothetical protein
MCILNFGAETLRIEDLGENGRIILNCIFKKQGSAKWKAVVSTAINCSVPQNAAHFLTS